MYAPGNAIDSFIYLKLNRSTRKVRNYAFTSRTLVVSVGRGNNMFDGGCNSWQMLLK